MLAFKDTEVSKDQLITVLEAHKKADDFVQGDYFTNGKGCAVGCSLHSFNEDPSDHFAYERLFGIPQVLARLEDRIFEGLSIKDSKEWPLRFTNAIKVGADLSSVYPLFMISILTDPEYGVIRHAKTKEHKKIIQDSADLFLDWPNIDRDKAKKVRGAAAAYAAYVAAHAADAAYAAAHAADAAYAAYAAAYAAYAAAYAAKENHYGWMADKIIELINEQEPLKENE